MGIIAKAVVVGIFEVFLLGCNPCSDRQIVESGSPDGAYLITTFVRNCGATTPFTTRVALRGVNIDDSRDHGLELFSVKGQHQIKLEWPESHNLRVVCPDCARADITYQMASFR